jgi:hypothetical protein
VNAPVVARDADQVVDDRRDHRRDVQGGEIGLEPLHGGVEVAHQLDE